MSAKVTARPSGTQSDEGKLAKKVNAIIGHVDFNMHLFAYSLYHSASPAVKQRLLYLAQTIQQLHSRS